MDEGRRTSESALNVVSPDQEPVVLEERGEADVPAGGRDALLDSSEVVVQPLDFLTDRLLGSEV
jgi:hypothetical protein